MPKTKETSNHPCHFLSLPSAKRFWCRHCMSVFEDAITRWRHSRSCRYGVVNNFMRRRQLEAKALQNTTKPNPIEARLEQSVSPSEEPIVEEVPGPSSSSPSAPSTSAIVKTNQGTSNDLFRCFICHNKFSTLEEMRHHVKYPCNNKKIVTDVPNPAVTVYIDEFTDRSRQWEPQPQTEEVVTSEFVPNIVSQETVQTNVELKTLATQESSGSSTNTISISSNKDGRSNITPTNIYVNEQGETVIEVENLDLNSEGGELSLAHLLTQLSQQGIVFDKTKASQMQAHHEVATISDPESGEVYATTTTYDPSARTSVIVKEEEESQSTAEDAANTLAQLAVFRGGYNRMNQEVVTEVPQTSASSDLQRQYVVEGVTSEGYAYTESYTVPHHIANAANDQQISIGGDLSKDIKVEYQYDYLPAGQTVTTDVQSAPQISIQPGGILHHPSVTTHHLGNIEVVRGEDMENVTVESQSMQIQQNQIQPQVVTYITPTTSSSSTIQHVQSSQGETTMMIEDFVMEHPNGTQTHYHQADEQHHHQQHPANISVSVSADGIVQSAEPYHHHHQQQTHEHTNIPTALLEAGQNSYIVFNSEDNSTQIINCDPNAPQGSENESVCGSTTTVSQASILDNEMIENHIREQERLQQLHQEQIIQQEQVQQIQQDQIQQIQQDQIQQIQYDQIQQDTIHDQEHLKQHLQQEQIKQIEQDIIHLQEQLLQHLQHEQIIQIQQDIIHLQEQLKEHLQQEEIQQIQQDIIHLQQQLLQHLQQEQIILDQVKQIEQDVIHLQEQLLQHLQQEQIKQIQQDIIHLQQQLLQHLQQDDQLQLPVAETIEHIGETRDTAEELKVQTVTLQEFVGTDTTITTTTESTDPMYACENHTTTTTTTTTLPTESVEPMETSTDDGGIAAASSNDNINNNTDSNSNNSLQLKQTIGDSYGDSNNVQLDINQQTETAINIIPDSSVQVQEVDTFTTVTIEEGGQHHQSPMCPEESTISISSEPENSSNMPVYVMSSQGDLQLVTSSSSLIQQQQQEQPSQ